MTAALGQGLLLIGFVVTCVVLMLQLAKGGDRR